MRLIGRHDFILVSGLAVAGVVIFMRPVASLLDAARDFERDHGMALGPGLVVLSLTLALYYRRRRQDLKARVTAAAAESRIARERARDLERLIALWQALASATDVNAIRDVIAQHVPLLVGQDEGWVLMRTGAHWEPLVGVAREAPDDLETWREDVAMRVLLESDGRARADGIDWEGHICFPLVADGVTLGVLGVSKGQALFSETRRRLLAAAAALVAAALKNAQAAQSVRGESVRDRLTGCVTAAYAVDLIDAELRRARRAGLPVSLILFELSGLDAIVEQHGRLCGDAVVAAVASRMQELLRGADVKCRHGADSFLVLLPETPLDGAVRVTHTLQREVMATSVQWGGETVSVAASFAVTSAIAGELDARAFIERGDVALDVARQQGPNAVRVAAVAGA